MSIRQAVLTDLSTVKHIAESVISEIYPHYYPKGAVEFFLEHHSGEKISDDIKRNFVYLCFDASRSCTFALMHPGTLSERLRLRIMKSAVFLFCLLIRAGDSAGKCLILPKESSLNGIQTLSWMPLCRRNKSI